MNTTRTNRTAAEMTAYLARTAAARTARATIRAQVATELGLLVADPIVVREAHRRMRAAR